MPTSRIPSSSRRSSPTHQNGTAGKKKPKVTNKKKQPGKVNLRMRKLLAYSLKMNDITDDVESLDSDNGAYSGTYFKNSTGPIVVIDGLKNADQVTLKELSSDIVEIHKNVSPNEIYLNLDGRLKDDARDQVIKDTLQEVNSVIAPRGKEYRHEFFNGFAKLHLVDIPEPVPLSKNQVMSTPDFFRAMGEDPKANIRPDQVAMKKPKPPTRYDAIVKVLDDYHDEVMRQAQLISRSPNQPDLSKEEFDAANKLIQAKIPALETALTDYLENSKKLKIPRKMIPLDKKYKAVEKLLQQLADANPLEEPKKTKKTILPQITNPPGINNEILNTARLNNLNRKYRPLRDAQGTTRQGALLGEGAQGPVFSKFFNTQDRPDLPKGFEAAVKFDKKKASVEAFKSGIPQDYPEQAKRAVATYEVSKLLGLNVIPPTTSVIMTNDQTQRQEWGYAMQRVTGVDGQLLGRPKKTLTQQQIQNYKLADKNIDNDRFVRVWSANGTTLVEAYEPTLLPVKVPWENNAIIQKELADLQILDNVIGHADRHFSNLMFEGSGPNNIKGVRGIDNDDTFGFQWVTRNNPRPDDFGKWSSKTPETPPVVDVHTAINVLQVTPNDLEPLKIRLTPEEYDATLQRLQTVQSKIKERIAAGELAIMPGSPLSDADKEFLARQGGLRSPGSLSPLQSWGSDNVYQAHLPPPTASGAQAPPTNSYLGEMVVMGQVEGTASWPNAN